MNRKTTVTTQHRLCKSAKDHLGLKLFEQRVSGDLFSCYTFGPVFRALYKHHRLTECCYSTTSANKLPVWPSSDGYFQQHNVPSQSLNQLKLASHDNDNVHCTPSTSTVTRFESNRAPPECVKWEASIMPDVITSRWANVSQERSQHLVKCAAGEWKHFCEISPPGC